MKSEEIGIVPTDRIVVKKLGQPKMQRGFYVPDSCKGERNRKAIWYGKIVKFGLDTNADGAYNLAVGDIVGIDPVGQDCDTVTLDNGEYVWVPQEFIALKDDGTLAKQYAKEEETASVGS